MNRHLALLFIVSGVLLVAVSVPQLFPERTTDAGDATSIEALLRGEPVEEESESAGSDAALQPIDRIGGDSSSTTQSAPSLTAPTTTTLAPLAEPVGLRIERLGVDAPVDPYGIAADGQMAVPHNISDVAWYEPGPGPGETGSAVLAAHVSLRNQGHGVFYDLKLLEPGDVVHVARADGSEQAFSVEARAIYLKEELPLESIFSREGPPILTLITCGGGFNGDARSYDSNVVVYAVPMAGMPARDRSLIPL